MTMQPLRPILTRDLRNRRWLLLAWIAVLLANVASRVLGPHLSVASTSQDLTMRSLGSLAFAHLVLMILGIALIVQTDVVVGTTAFWLTRPIARTTMLRAKLVSSFVIIVLPALVIEAILMAAYGMSPLTIAGQQPCRYHVHGLRNLHRPQLGRSRLFQTDPRARARRRQRRYGCRSWRAETVC